MKLVIDISEDDYRKVQDGRASVSMMRKAIRNGTPLDKIRAEIEQTAKDYDKFADYRRIYGLWIALEIIDKYRAETEQVGNPDRLGGD